MADQVIHLNRNTLSPLYSKLKRSIDESKQGKAVPAQWASMIKAMSAKGVKSMEIDESNIIDWLENQKPEESITRETLSKKLDSMLFTIKEVCLQSPKFKGHRQAGGTYKEYLYIANSERDNIIDDLESIEYEMEELVFNLERLSDEPDLVVNLERERTRLISLKGVAIDFTQHHFSGETTGRHGKNLLAHCRVTERPTQGLYFIEEVQSDWAQTGRKRNWINIPKGPLVTNTEAWAGMVLRRHLQIAAMNPQVQHIGWITESMRNGGRQNKKNESEKLTKKTNFDTHLKEGLILALSKIESEKMSPDALKEATLMARKSVIAELSQKGIQEPYDMLNDFYLKVIPKMVDKILAGTGEKVQIKDIEIDPGNTASIPCLVVTDKVRERLTDKQPIYSRALLLKTPIDANDAILETVIKNAAQMLGSAKHLRLVTNLFDISTGAKVAGRFLNNMVQVSLSSKDILEVCDHECFHFAQEKLFSQQENQLVLESFAYGTQLNEQVREILTSRGDFVLAKECLDPVESAAQGFALWNSGQLDLDQTPVRGIFSDLITAVKEVAQWIGKNVLQQNYQTTEELFQAFATGEIGKREKETQRMQAKYHKMA